eukprot:UN02971
MFKLRSSDSKILTLKQDIFWPIAAVSSLCLIGWCVLLLYSCFKDPEKDPEKEESKVLLDELDPETPAEPIGVTDAGAGKVKLLLHRMLK